MNILKYYGFQAITVSFFLSIILVLSHCSLISFFEKEIIENPHSLPEELIETILDVTVERSTGINPHFDFTHIVDELEKQKHDSEHPTNQSLPLKIIQVPHQTCNVCNEEKMIHDFPSLTGNRVATCCKECIKKYRKRTENEILRGKTLRCAFMSYF